MIKNAWVLPRVGGPLIHDGVVWIQDGIVQYAGKSDCMPAIPGGIRTLDARSGLVMPGFINAHTHFYSAFALGLMPKGDAPSGFMDMLEKLWWPLDSVLTEEDLYYGTVVTALKCIRAGTTSVFDHHESQGFQHGVMDVLAGAVRDSGLRASLCLGVSDRYGKGKEGVRETARFLQACKTNPDPDGLVVPMAGLHALFTVEDETLDAIVSLCRQYRAGLHVHTAEAAEDQVRTMQQHGLSVIHRLFRHEGLTKKTLCVHGVHLSRSEMELIARAGASVIHNPQSNMNNAVGVARVPDMLKAKIRVGLGTDGMTMNMLEEVRAARLLQSLATGTPGFLPEAASLLLSNNPKIARSIFGRPVGELKKGGYGDLIVLDYNPATALTKDNAMGHLFYGLPETRIHTTVIHGRILMKDGEIQHVDEKAMISRAQELSKACWKRFHAKK
jgi:putative selenium metabolism protein SsnA